MTRSGDSGHRDEPAAKRRQTGQHAREHPHREEDAGRPHPEVVLRCVTEDRQRDRRPRHDRGDQGDHPDGRDHRQRPVAASPRDDGERGERAEPQDDHAPRSWL